jgi:hypothetical protein
MKKIITVIAVAAGLAFPSSASALTQTQANNDAEYFSAVDCPHHGSEKCLHRDWVAYSALTNGRWRIETRGWGCYWWEPCAFQSYVTARWFYYRHCTLETNHTRNNCSEYGDW